MPMASQTINDWIIKVGYNDSEVIKGAKRTARTMDRINQKQRRASGGGGTGGGGGPRRGSTTFGLADDRQLKLANSIDTVMRRAGRTIGKNTEEFRKLNNTAQTLKGTIAGISSRSGLERLNNQIVRLRENVNMASSAMRNQRTVAQSLKVSLNSLAKSYLGVFAAVEGGRAILQTGSKFDSLQASLLAASGGAEQAAKDFEFIKGISSEMGISLLAVADGYRQIGAAARASGVSSENMNKQFRQMTKLSRSFGLTAADTSLVMLAFQQMISKGVVSSEELRRQLGERLPGAIPQAAKALGVTTLELDKLLRSGKVVTKDFLPKFLTQMEEFVDESGAYEKSLKTITAANQRFTSAVQLGIVGGFGAGAKSGLVNFLDRITESITQLTPLFKIFGAVVGVGLHVVTSALDVLAPVLAVTSTLLGSFVEIFEDAFNLDKPASQISILSQGVRTLSGVFLVAIGTIQTWLGELQKLITSTGELSGVWKVVMQVLGAFFALKMAKSLLSPIKSVKSLASAFGSLGSKISTMVTFLLRGLGLIKSVGSAAAGLLGTAAVSSAAAVTGAGAAGFGAGTLIHKGLQAAPVDIGFLDTLGEGIARSLAFFGNDEAQAAVNARDRFEAQKSSVTTTNEINITVDAPNADSREVANMVSEAFEEKLRDNNASLATF